jgi:hypothetical protein
MAIETARPSSRRAILAAGLASAAALVAQAVGRPLAARATNGDPMTAGNVVGASATTGATTTGGNALQGVLNAQTYDQAGSAIYGEANGSYNAYGVYGTNTNGYGVGVLGVAGDYAAGVEGRGGTGVYGHSARDWGIGLNAQASGANSNGLYARSSGAGGKAVYAYADSGVAVAAEAYGTVPAVTASAGGNSTGVVGLSGPGAAAAPAKTGVYGYAAQDATARGVLGQTTVGRGVEGRATTGLGMFARATTGQGIQASATTGVAVYAYADTNGTALRTTRGLVKFNTAGLATILAGTSSVTVAPGFDISLNSKVLAVLQGNPGGSTVLRYVLRDDPNNRFTIQLSANATVNTPVAWFVIS